MADVLGRYHLLEPIGVGGLGDVYRARDTLQGRTVALKVLSQTLVADAVLRGLLLEEARRASLISHPNVATLFEVGADPAHAFLAFEFVPGDSLRAVMGDRPLNPRRAIDLAAQIAEGLAEIHRCGLVHEDIRPANVALTQTGRAKILDVGLARWTTAGRVRHFAATGAQSVSSQYLPTVIAYMSPEQVLGGRVDHRTDLFSLGVVLHEILSGRSPFLRDTIDATLVEIMRATPPAPSASNPSVPAALDAVVARALSKSLDGRYGSAAEMASDLRTLGAALEAAAAKAEMPTPVRAPRHTRRMGPWMIALALAMLVALVLWVLFWKDEGGPRRPNWFRRAPSPVISQGTPADRQAPSS